MKIKMRALKPMRYLTRRLRAGEEFQATRHASRVLKAVGRAEILGRELKAITEPEPEPVRDELAEARARYETVFDEPANRRWGLARINVAIEQQTAEVVESSDEGGLDADEG